jgi:pimeloyl-ACP methyl ester carboxylesterase
LNALLNFLGVDQAVLIGLSSGGGIALDFALTHPQKVLGLVLSAPFVNGYKFSDAQQQRVASFGSAAQRGADEYVKTILADSYFIPAPQNPEARKRAEVFIKENFRPFDFSLIKQLDPPTIARVAEINKPTLLLIGNLDHADVQKRTEFLEKTIRGAKKVAINNAGHLVNLEVPQDFNRATREFLVAMDFYKKNSSE